MTWNQQFPSGIQPSIEQISAYVASPYWDSLCSAMVSVGQKEDHEAQLLLPSLTPYVQQLYRETFPFNGGRWLSVVVGNPEILEDTLALIDLRVPPSRRWQVQQ